MKHWESLPSVYGGCRRVYLGEEWVWKVGLNNEGWLANQIEADWYAANVARPDLVEIPIAECLLLSDGVLQMRRVHRVAELPLEDRPGWVDYVDCGQVGFLDGALVAYDL